MHGADTPIYVDEDDFNSDEEEASARKTVTDHLQALSLNPQVPNLVGKSSVLMLVRTILDTKSASPDDPPMAMPGIIQKADVRFWEIQTVSLFYFILSPL